ncbi:hypothetical protein ADUPG1_009295 [Aduncisulcus paluster]|uniref:Uncharacterized protein n=1 Tax=Aduncisulcus paluster TaxID=2918883 RepID=A0ABQ5KV15_9EUKA|nr:hypothetical protein ADUPG1_009295 [Aduncisulcus paluster]
MCIGSELQSNGFINDPDKESLREETECIYILHYSSLPSTCAPPWLSLTGSNMTSISFHSVLEVVPGCLVLLPEMPHLQPSVSVTLNPIVYPELSSLFTPFLRSSLLPFFLPSFLPSLSFSHLLALFFKQNAICLDRR